MNSQTSRKTNEMPDCTKTRLRVQKTFPVCNETKTYKMTFPPFFSGIRESRFGCPRIARVISSEELGTMSKNNLRRTVSSWTHLGDSLSYLDSVLLLYDNLWRHCAVKDLNSESREKDLSFELNISIRNMHCKVLKALVYISRSAQCCISKTFNHTMTLQYPIRALHNQ